MRLPVGKGGALLVPIMLVAALAGCASSGEAPSPGAPDPQAAPRESAAATSEEQDSSQSEEQGISQPAVQGASRQEDQDASQATEQDIPQQEEQGVPTPEDQDAPQPEGQGTTRQDFAEDAARADDTKEERAMKLSIDGTDVAVAWEDNQAVADLRTIAADGPVVIELSRYGGFEQVGPLGARLTTSDVQMTTQPGDIVLYAGDQISIFYGPNSWAYTKLGHISDRTPEEMADLLGNDDVSIAITID